MAASSSSSSVPLQPQVFINFRGELRNNFVDFLVSTMREKNINVFMDKDELRGKDLQEIFVRIEESKVAIVIFSKNYTSSKWCLSELARIKDCVDRGTLTAIPIFYKVTPSVVKGLIGDFGVAFETLNQHNPVTEKWVQAIESISRKHGMELQEHGQKTEREFIGEIIKEVQRLLEDIKKAAQKGQLITIQNIQSEAAQIQPPNVNHQGCMFNARQLSINESHNARNWSYMSISESPNGAPIEVAKMVICYDLKVFGEFNATKLTLGKRYEVVFVVKIEDTMSRFDILAKTQLMVPDNKLQEQELQFVDLIKNEWIEIRAGVFDAWPHEENIDFSLYQDGSEKKMTGLLIKSAIIRPVKPKVVQEKLPKAIHIQQLNVNHDGCMFNARQLKIRGSHNARHWTFVSISESPNEAVTEVAKMVICYDLQVCGEFDTTNLAVGKRYEVVFVVKIKNTMSRFDIRAKAQLIVPNEKLQEQELQFVELRKNEWVEIHAGVFDVWPHTEKIAFYLDQDGSEKKMTGLLVKSAIVRPIKSEIGQNKQPKAIHTQQPNVDHRGCVFNARQLTIRDSHNARNWTYVSVSKTPNEASIEVAKMVICYDLQVRGEFDTTKLTFGKTYEVVFVVKIEDTMSRFDILAKTQLMVPDNELQQQELQFVDLIKNEWIEIRAGVFYARPHKEKIAFYLLQDGSENKMTGILIKSAIVRLIKPEVVPKKQSKAIHILPLKILDLLLYFSLVLYIIGRFDEFVNISNF